MRRDLICLHLLQLERNIISHAGNVFVAIYIRYAYAGLSDRGLNITEWIFQIVIGPSLNPNMMLC